MALHIAADIGGTFTDFTVRDLSTGSASSFKVLTTYPDRAVGLLQGLARAFATNGYGSSSGRSYASLARFAHGSTVATNALVEMAGARCGLITTRGFRDLLELGRQKRPHLYDLQADKPVPLVPRALRREVTERMLASGEALIPLDEKEVIAVAHELVAAGVEAIAITFLHAYANPAHEARAKSLVAAEFPGLAVYTSSEVSPQFREFERLSTTVVNAFVSPPIARYLEGLNRAFTEGGAETEPLVMKGDAGIATVAEASADGVSTIGSGPAGGVVGARSAAIAAGIDGDLITFDMGGTSTDVSLVVGGKPLTTDQRSVAGWPIRGAALDVESIGAGGGSVAWVDAGGLLRVGPRSAGSTPGPACYGRGGFRPTITDANVVLGRLESLLAGEFPLRRDLAEAAIAEHVARPLGLSVTAAAHGMLAVAAAHMEQAIRLMTVERGFDPREFVLVAYGGAGALHAPMVAESLSIGRVLVPADSGVLSSQGILTARLSREFTLTRVMHLASDTIEDVRGALEELRARARSWSGTLASEAALTGGADEWQGRERGTSLELAVDMRCAGQNYELTVPFPDRETPVELLENLTEAFHGVHERTYGYAFRGSLLECVTFRVRARLGAAPDPLEQREPTRAEWTMAQPVGTRAAYWDRDAPPVSTPVFTPLPPGAVIDSGPALIEAEGATVAVWPGQRVEALDAGALLITTATTLGRA